MAHQVTQGAPNRSGVAASLGASALFGITFVLPPLLLPLDPQQILGYRIVVTLAILACCLARSGHGQTWRRHSAAVTTSHSWLPCSSSMQP